MTTRRLVVVAAGLSQPSSTRLLADRLATATTEALADQDVSVELEAGWDHTDQRGGTSGSLWKVTLAPQITPTAAVLSRPSLRAYVTWASWSDGFVGLVAPVRYGADDGGFAAGVQLETWW